MHWSWYSGNLVETEFGQHQLMRESLQWCALSGWYFWSDYKLERIGVWLRNISKDHSLSEQQMISVMADEPTHH